MKSFYETKTKYLISREENGGRSVSKMRKMVFKLLDLDAKETWHSDFENLIYSQEVWQTIMTKLDSIEVLAKNFLFQISCADESVNDSFIRFLRNKGREILNAQYTHVAGYHGCRCPMDLMSYQANGILPSDPGIP